MRGSVGRSSGEAGAASGTSGPPSSTGAGAGGTAAGGSAIVGAWAGLGSRTGAWGCGSGVVTVDELVRLVNLAPGDETRIRETLVSLVPDFHVPEKRSDVLTLRTRVSGEHRRISGTRNQLE